MKEIVFKRNLVSADIKRTAVVGRAEYGWEEPYLVGAALGISFDVPDNFLRCSESSTVSIKIGGYTVPVVRRAVSSINPRRQAREIVRRIRCVERALERIAVLEEPTVSSSDFAFDDEDLRAEIQLDDF